jgi:hypothetical protein
MESKTAKPEPNQSLMLRNAGSGLPPDMMAPCISPTVTIPLKAIVRGFI